MLFSRTSVKSSSSKPVVVPHWARRDIEQAAERWAFQKADGYRFYAGYELREHLPEDSSVTEQQLTDFIEANAIRVRVTVELIWQEDDGE